MGGCEIDADGLVDRSVVEFREEGDCAFGNASQDLVDGVEYFGECEGEGVVLGGDVVLGVAILELPDAKFGPLSGRGSTSMMRTAPKLP